MKPLARVVWSEGMHLAQHHFQAQNRYFEESIDFAISRVGFERYGVLGLELDAEALRNGTVAISYGRGFMPDGLPFNMPQDDPTPPARDIREVFVPTHDSHILYLTIPEFRDGAANCALNGESAPLRYRAEPVDVLDETTGRDRREVLIGRKNFALVLDHERVEGTEALALARVRRDGSGHFIYDPAYIPPSLQLLASPRIVEILERLVEILGSKATTFSAERAGERGSVAEYGPTEVAGFWLMHTILQSLAPLRHHLQSKRSHPEVLYMEMARLAGALCTFSLGSDSRDVPEYDHENLTDSLNDLDRHIRRHLEITLPTACVTIPLERHEKYVFLHSAAVTDPRCFEPGTEWILGVRADSGTAALIRDVRHLVKLASKRDVARLVKEGLGGLGLDHVTAPPSVISPRLGSEYFRVTCTGPLWKAMVQEREIGAYVPEALPNPQLEILAVLQDR